MKKLYAIGLGLHLVANTVFARGGGGCFLPDTPILKADGSRVLISELKVGDRLLAFTGDEAVVATTVREVLTHDVDEFLIVRTDRVELRVTGEHPFYVGAGMFKPVAALRPGDLIYALDGSQPIRSIERVSQPVRVYNLLTAAPHTYFANGIAVHNKGGGGGGGGGSHGGGGYHGRSGGGSGRPMTPGERRVFFTVFGGIVVFVIIANIAAKRRAADANLDFCYSVGDVEPKAVKTRKLLDFIARTDAAFTEEKLRQRATEVFIKLQECWQAREYSPMQPLLMPDLYREHCNQLAGLKRNHEINMIESLRVERVDIVNVRYPQKPAQREFTALITATARDYYLDDRTQSFLRGDDQPAAFQEFWTFQFFGGQWLLREVEQTRESDVLKDENFFEPFTDKGVEQVYGAAAGQAGPAGPWLDKATATKATRIERLLNFLVQTDKLWDRQAMLDRARQVFLDVLLARESGTVDDAGLFPATAAALRAEIAERQQHGARIEYRNLCVRKVELVHVNNQADSTQDEFTVRISAHAQRIIQKGGVEVGRDEDVTPFTQFWTFGRHDGQWKLKEVLPDAKGEELQAQENVDAGTSPEQLEWYYRQTRAT
ncbi:MAG: TIM44-like domain-containing protein [Verrucomicrobiota bacterium]